MSVPTSDLQPPTSARTRLAATVAIAMLAFCSAATTSPAGPADYLNLAPAAHEVFLYVDVAQIRNSKMYNNLKDDLLVGQVQAGIAMFEQFTGMRLPDDLDVLAASGKIAQDNQGCVFVRGRMDRARLESLLAMNAGYTEMVKPGGKIIGYLDENKGTMSYLSFLSDNLVVVGQKEGVEGALGVVAGEGALAHSPAMKAQIANAGTSPVLVVLARQPQVLTPDLNKIPAIESVKSILLTLVPGPDVLTLTARIEADSEEMAARFLDIARGLIAVGQIQEQSPPLAELAQGMSASKRGMIVTLTAPVQTAKAETFIRQRVKQRGARRANIGGRRVQGTPEEKPVPPQW